MIDFLYTRAILSALLVIGDVTMMTLYLNPRTRRFSQTRATNVHIPVDVSANGEEYVLRAYLPGLKADDVQIEVLENTIRIHGEFISPELAENEQRMLRELPSGAFERTLRLPTDLDAGRAQAEMQDGLLTLRVAKAEHAKSKKISVLAK